MTAEMICKIQKDLNEIKKVFLTSEYNDIIHGWIVEDYINSIQETLNEYRNKEFKASEPDPFA